MNILQWAFIFGTIQVTLLVGCVASEPLPKSYQNQFDLTVNWEDNPTLSAPKELEQLGELNGYTAVGKGECIITAKKPTGEGDYPALETLGHELFHCTDQNYHGDK